MYPPARNACSVIIGCLCMIVPVVLADYDISNKIIFPNLPNAAPRAENKVCREESQSFIENLNNFTLWAHTMWDATSKSTTGTLQGSIFNFGNWHECMSVDGPFRTQYCFATITADIPEEHSPEDELTLRFNPMDNVLKRLYKTQDVSKQFRNMAHIGWCVPASCTSVDLEKSIHDYLTKLEHPFNKQNVSYTGNVFKNSCQTERETEAFDTVDILFCLLAAGLIVLVILGTIYDVRTDKKHEEKEKTPKESPSHKYYMAFSARQSYQELVRPDETNSPLKVLYGLRTFSILMIIMDHRFGTYISGPIDNFNYIEKEYRSVSAWFIFHGDLFVDNFFILSGILVTYGLLNQLDKKYVHPGFIILLRYIRLTPVYAFVIFFWSSMFGHIGTGPFWKFIIPQDVLDCRKNWWANLMYISNYVDDDHMCMTHSWYLPCDFHYFIIAIFIVMLIKKNKIYGFGLMLLLFVLALAIPFIITMVYLRPALLHFYPSFLTSPKTDKDFQLTYIKSHTRASTYFIGMFTGYVFYKLKGTDYQISKIKSHTITLISILLMVMGMASGAVFYNPYHEYDSLEAASYASLHRAAWGFGIVGLLMSASYGHLTVLYNMSSWYPWIPLSKLVYGAYLTHMLFQLRAVAVATNPRHFTYFDTICLGLGDMVLAFATALLLFVIIENPFRKVIRELLTPTKPRVAVINPVASTSSLDFSTRNSSTSEFNTNHESVDSRL